MAEALSAQPDETPKAALAFAAYIAMGHRRSLANLARLLVEQNHYKTVATAKSHLATWSVKYHWQDRIAAAITEKSERMLVQASEIDAKTFLRTSELLAERIAWTDPGHIDVVIKARESVRKPAPKGSASVDVNLSLSVSVRALVERAAQEAGLDVDEVVAEAERLLAGR